MSLSSSRNFIQPVSCSMPCILPSTAPVPWQFLAPHSPTDGEATAGARGAVSSPPKLSSLSLSNESKLHSWGAFEGLESLRTAWMLSFLPCSQLQKHFCSCLLLHGIFSILKLIICPFKRFCMRIYAAPMRHMNRKLNSKSRAAVITYL